jgi:putative ubiquitin-RnfH superfamily antitoxin RatB of RatAB toxin-antitoxin module
MVDKITADKIMIEVAYALPERQTLIALEVPAGTTLEQAIALSGICRQYPEIDLAVNRVGIFSKLTTLDAPLQAGDRVEIYRPLLIDPKEARRRRALTDRQKNNNG